MKAEKWLILGALAGLAGIAINKQLRLARHREESQPDVDGRSSIDDIPEDVPTIQAAAEGRTPEGRTSSGFDEQIAPGAPF